MRDDLHLDPGDALTVRVEETGDGRRQMVIWRAEEQLVVDDPRIEEEVDDLGGRLDGLFP